MSNELKPCPFCGGTNIFHIVKSPHEFAYGHRYVCYSCMAKSPLCKSKDEATQKWNTRPVEDGFLNDNITLAECIGKFASMSLDEFALWQNKLKHGGSNETRNQD